LLHKSAKSNFLLEPEMKKHHEKHRIEKIGWLRAAVLGANDGIISTASLVLGVAAAHATHGNIMLTGIAGLVAGTMSMATGEYVSVHFQADTEKAALAEEAAEIKADFPASNVNWRVSTCVADLIFHLRSRLLKSSWRTMPYRLMHATNSA
jgi:hypothetical protein